MVQIQMWLIVCVLQCNTHKKTCKKHTHQTTQIPNVDTRYIALLCKTSESLENNLENKEEIGRITQKHGIKSKTVALLVGIVCW